MCPRCIHRGLDALCPLPSSRMADPWYCMIAGAQTGPLSAAQLKALAVEGRLFPQDQVRQGTVGPWVVAGQVKGLFPVAGPASGGAN